MAETALSGRTGAGGIAIGTIHIVRSQIAAEAAVAGITLPDAIATAITQLRALQNGIDATAAEIVQFQIELLDDEALSEDALREIAKGADPIVAFRAAVAVHLADYESAQSEQFRARAADIHDLRDRVVRILSGVSADAAPGQGVIVICDEFTPTAFLEIDWTRARGAASFKGSPASHVAMLARARGVPLVVDLQAAPDIAQGTQVILDADAGTLLLDPDTDTLRRYRKKAETNTQDAERAGLEAGLAAVTQGGRRVRIYLNVDGIESLAAAPRDWFDGIGLTRTELLFGGGGLPDEHTQSNLYARLFDWSDGSPTAIRLLDAGGDKPVAGLTSAGEANPFLGVRGVRLLLKHVEILKVQLRAIVRAAKGRPARIMIPMITVVDEFSACCAVLDSIVAELGTDAQTVMLGMMVETPAAALTIDAFPADFYSVGTNDLTQYVMAVARDCSALDYLQTPTNPAILELVRRVVEHGRRVGREVSICGDAVSSLPTLAALLKTGVEAISVPAVAAPAVKAAIRMLDLTNE